MTADMTSPQDTDVTWISCKKDLKVTKLCPFCCQPMTVKQVNFTEACRACFNPECSPQLMDVPDIEFFHRSYMDIPEEGERPEKGFSSKPISVEGEVDKVNTWFSKIERSLMGTFKNENTRNFKSEVVEDTDFTVKVTNGFRCYRLNKGHPVAEAATETKTSLNSNLLGKEWSNLCFSPDLDVSLSHHDDQSIEKRENWLGKEESEFLKDGGTDLQRISLQPTVVPVEQPLNRTVQPLRFMVLPDENGGTKVIDLNQNSNKNANLNTPATGEVSDKLVFNESVITNLKKYIQFPPKERKKVSPQKPVPANTSDVSSTETSLTDILKGNGKPVSGFNELKSFGGAKSSLMAAEIKSKLSKSSKQPARRKRVIKNTKTRSKTGSKTESNNINDDIEKAIADMQHSNKYQHIQWDQMFVDLFPK